MLGDDVVIGSVQAKDVYLDIMALLGVEISLNKSVMSEDGSSFEFTKRNIINGVDASSIS
jgi:hypothetical protein